MSLLDRAKQRREQYSGSSTGLLERAKARAAVASTGTNWNAAAQKATQVYDPNKQAVNTIIKAMQVKSKPVKTKPVSSVEKAVLANQAARQAVINKILPQAVKVAPDQESVAPQVMRGASLESPPAVTAPIGNIPVERQSALADLAKQIYASRTPIDVNQLGLSPDETYYVAQSVRQWQTEPSVGKLISGAANIAGQLMEAVGEGGAQMLEQANLPLPRDPITGELNPTLRKTIKNAAGLLPYVLPGMSEAAVAAQLPGMISASPETGEPGAVSLANGVIQRIAHPIKAIKEGELPNMIFDAAMLAHGAGKLGFGDELRSRIMDKVETDLAAGRLNKAINQAVKGDAAESLSEIRMHLEDVPEFRDLPTQAKAEVLRDVGRRLRGEAGRVSAKQVIKQSKVTESAKVEPIEQKPLQGAKEPAVIEQEQTAPVPLQETTEPPIPAVSEAVTAKQEQLAEPPAEQKPANRRLDVLDAWYTALEDAKADPQKYQAVSKGALNLYKQAHQNLDDLVAAEPALQQESWNADQWTPEQKTAFENKWDNYWQARNDNEEFVEQMDSHPMVQTLQQMEAAPEQQQALQTASQYVREQNRAAYQFGKPIESSTPIYSKNTKTGRLGKPLKGYDWQELSDALGMTKEETAEIIKKNAVGNKDNIRYGSDATGWRGYAEPTSDFLTVDEAKPLAKGLGLKIDFKGSESSNMPLVQAAKRRVAAQQVKASEVKTDDTQNVEGLPGDQSQGQAPEQIEPEQVTGGEETQTSRVLQTPEVKQPWEMTRNEWNANTRFYRSGKTKNAQLPTGERVMLKIESTPKTFLDVSGDFLNELRKHAIQKALSENKPVPAEVLADYPDLVAKHQPVETKVAQTEIPVSSEPVTYTKPYNATKHAFSNTKIRGKEGQQPVEGDLFEKPQQDLFVSSGAASEGGYARPEEIGEHGPVYHDYRHTSNEAVRKLLAERKGEIPEALHHQAVPGGWIDLLWGNAGDTHQKGYGLAKIEKWHPEALDDLQGHLSDMKISDINDNSIKLESDTHYAVVRRNWKGNEKHWLLTAYEKKNPSSAERTMDVSGTSEEGDGRQTPQPEDGSTVIDNTTFNEDVNQGSSGQASGSGYTRPTRHAPPTLKAKPSGKVDMSKDVAPMEMPEMVELAKAINHGQYPVIKKQLRLMHGMAAGAFYPAGGRIELRSDIFLGDHIASTSVKLSGATKEARSAERKTNIDTLRAQVAKDKDLPLDDVVVRYERDRKSGKDIYKAYHVNPDLAPQVLSHEIGHLVDWLPDQDLKRGNILGHVATLKHFLKTTIGELPTKPDAVLDTKTRNRLGREAKSTVSDSGLRGEELREETKRVYNALINKELEKRGLVKRDVVMDELNGLSQVWKPFDPETADPKYLKYRHSPAELYADAVSVLFNNPGLAQREAPTFYKMFVNYMERKPAVQKAYQAIQNRYTNREALTDKRLNDIYEMQERGNEARQEAALRNESGAERAIDTLARGLIDEQWPALKGIGKREKLMGTEQHDIGEAARNARLELEESKYIGSQVANYMSDLDNTVLEEMTKNNLSYEDLGTYMFLRRVGADRQGIANPLGHTSSTASETLTGLKKRLGDERYAALGDVANKYRTLRESYVFPKIEAAGIYDPELMNLIKESKDYAKFSVTKYLEDKFGGGVSARVHKQVGTLSEIENPFIATVLQDVSMLRAAKINTVKRAVIDDLINAKEIQPAETRYSRDVMGKVPVEPKDPRIGMITVMRDGVPENYYVAKPIADMFEYSPLEATKIGEVWARVNGFMRDILVSKNPGWMGFNIVRDTKATIKNIPDIHIQDMPRLAAAYGSALKDSWNEVFRGKASEDVRAMREDFMLSPERMYSSREHNFDNEIERMVNDFVLKRDENRDARMILVKAWAGLMETMDKFGKVSERTSKLAGYKYLDRYGLYDRKELAHIIRTRVGTPDFKRRGSWQAITNNIFMFSNVNKEGVRSAWESFESNKGAYIWKTIAMNILPKLMLIAAGVVGGVSKTDEEDGSLRRCINGIPDYDKRFYDVVPLGLDKHGKSVYLRIPQDYEGQFWGALVWDMTHAKIAGKDGAISLVAEQSPYKMHPLITTATDLYQYYVQGINPMDEYRGRNVISDTAFEAGGWKASEQMLKHAWSEAGGKTVYTPTWGGVVEDETPLEEALKLPGLNAFGRFLKVSDRGHAEAMQDVAEEVRQEEAQRRTSIQSEIISTVNAGKTNKAEAGKLYKRLVAKKLVDPKKQSPREFYAQSFRRYANRANADPLTSALLSAKSNVEKLALLKEHKKTVPKKDYASAVRTLVAKGVVSKNVAAEALGHSRTSTKQVVKED